MSFCHYKKKKKKKRESESDFYSNLKSEQESRQSRGNKKVQKIDSIDATNSVCLFAWVLGFMHEFKTRSHLIKLCNAKLEFILLYFHRLFNLCFLFLLLLFFFFMLLYRNELLQVNCNE